MTGKMKKSLPKSGRKDEIRRQDRLAEVIDEEIVKPFKRVERLSKALKLAGTVITVAISVYGLIPKTDKLPAMDNQRFEIMSE